MNEIEFIKHIILITITTFTAVDAIILWLAAIFQEKIFKHRGTFDFFMICCFVMNVAATICFRLVSENPFNIGQIIGIVGFSLLTVYHILNLCFSNKISKEN